MPPIVALSQKQTNDQRFFIQDSAQDLCKITAADDTEKIMLFLQRFEFNLRLREMDYVQKMQTKNGHVRDSSFDIGAICPVVRALDKIAEIMLAKAEQI